MNTLIPAIRHLQNLPCFMAKLCLVPFLPHIHSVACCLCSSLTSKTIGEKDVPAQQLYLSDPSALNLTFCLIENGEWEQNASWYLELGCSMLDFPLSLLLVLL